MSALKPCPFCGGTNLYMIYKEDYWQEKTPEIFCATCKAVFSVESMNCEDRVERTVEAWNRRAKDE